MNNLSNNAIADKEMECFVLINKKGFGINGLSYVVNPVSLKIPLSNNKEK